MTQFRPSRFEILPLIVKNLLIINVLVFIAQNTFRATGWIDMEGIFALHHVKSPLFQPWQLITHMFLHGGFTHLFFNMFSLWMFGSVLESVWGPKRFLTFYFICGLGAAILQLAFLWYDSRNLLDDFLVLRSAPTPDGIMAFIQQYRLRFSSESIGAFKAYINNPNDGILQRGAISALNNGVNEIISTATLGASGGVSGILAAFIFLYPNTYLYLYFFVPVKAKWLGIAYFGYELYAGIVNSDTDNIAHWAHLGGALVGLLLVLTWNKTNRKTLY
jgi:membrane associated rhomboid family serine protease